MIAIWLLIALLLSCYTNRAHVEQSDGYTFIVIGRMGFYLAWPLVLLVWFGTAVRNYLLGLRS